MFWFDDLFDVVIVENGDMMMILILDDIMLVDINCVSCIVSLGNLVLEGMLIGL